MAGETDLVPQLAVEQVDLIRGGKLKPLAVLGDTPLVLKGVADPIPPITKWIPQLKAGSNWFGVWLPNTVPENIRNSIGKAFDKVIANSQLIKDYCLANGAIFGPSWGAEAQKRAMAYITPVAWTYSTPARRRSPPTRSASPSRNRKHLPVGIPAKGTSARALRLFRRGPMKESNMPRADFITSMILIWWAWRSSGTPSRCPGTRTRATTNAKGRLLK